MKTTADLLIENGFAIEYYGTKFFIHDSICNLIKNHYKNSAFDDVTENVSTSPFSFLYMLEEWKEATFHAHVSLVYSSGIINISIVHDSVKCPKCKGTGEYTFGSFHDEDDDECDECFGTGEFCGNWDILMQENWVDLPKQVHYKTIDLNQGELELA